MSKHLRHYQADAKAAVFREWETVPATLVVLPTGVGKTVLFAAIIEACQPERSLVLAHREELIWQAKEKIERFAKLDCEIEMAELYANTHTLFASSPVVISTVQTQGSNRGARTRMSRFKPTDFGRIVFDECFPAGTLVDGRAVETIRIGDQIKTHNGFGRVSHVFKKPVESMCVITFANRETLVCTPNHPIWTQRGFQPAWSLTKNDVVLTITDHEQLRNLQNRNSRWAQAVLEPKMQVLLEQGHHPELVQETRRGDYPVPKNQRNARPGGAGQSFHKAKGDWVEADSPGRQRTWSYDSRAGVGGGAWVAVQCRSEDADGQTQWISDLLQVGCGQFGFTDWGRGGRILTLLSGAEASGLQEGGVLEFQRVASVKVYEPSDRDAVEWLCPEGAVYNLEVSNGNTYFAAGVLVHNCHHCTATSYRNIVNYYKQNPAARFLGVTATPDRSDEEALGQVFDTVAFDYEILDAIHDGWLVPIQQQFVQAMVDLSAVRTTAGDLNGADLAAVMEAEENLQGVAGATLQIIDDKRTIVFTASVKQAEILCNIFNRHRTGMANWVCGKTNKDVRRQMLTDFKDNKFQVICNCGVLTEGYDDWGVEVIAMARPTKSRALYAQMAGRATRTAEGLVDPLPTPEARREAIARSGKPSCLIIDFVGNSGKHKLMTTADILGGKRSDDAIARAIQIAKTKGGPVDMVDLLDESEELVQEELKQKRLQEEARKARLIAKVKYSTKIINPFDAWDLDPVRERGWDNGKVLSEKQRHLLMKQGIDPDSMHYSAAKAVLNEMFRRFNKKLCTIRQAALLKKHGFEAKELGIAQATQLIDQIKANGWKRPAGLEQPKLGQFNGHEDSNPFNE